MQSVLANGNRFALIAAAGAALLAATVCGQGAPAATAAVDKVPRCTAGPWRNLSSSRVTPKPAGQRDERTSRPGEWA